MKILLGRNDDIPPFISYANEPCQSEPIYTQMVCLYSTEDDNVNHVNPTNENVVQNI